MLDRNHYSYIVPGYSGHIPAHILEQPEEKLSQVSTAHIPGYIGYVKSIKSENLFGKTYGKITDNVAHNAYHSGPDVEPMERYTSLNREAYCDLAKIHDKKIAQVVGVNPPQEIYKAPLPKQILHDFFGVQSKEEQVAFDLYAESRKKDGGGQAECHGEIIQCHGKEGHMQIGEPIPGYTGMNRRLVADNVFGLTYANARKASKLSQQQVKGERGQILQGVSTEIPPIRK